MYLTDMTDMINLNAIIMEYHSAIKNGDLTFYAYIGCIIVHYVANYK